MNDNPFTKVEPRLSILVTENVVPNAGHIAYDAETEKNLKNELDVSFFDEAAVYLLA